MHEILVQMEFEEMPRRWPWQRWSICNPKARMQTHLDLSNEILLDVHKETFAKNFGISMAKQ